MKTIITMLVILVLISTAILYVVIQPTEGNLGSVVTGQEYIFTIGYNLESSFHIYVFRFDIPSDFVLYAVSYGEAF